MTLFLNFADEMSDIIHLLPESVANQIAAGEVVQRPASAVKELLENSIDSGASEIQLIIKESGKQLIQVTDNGCGLSERDARMCFERHATSKIKKSEDLLNIRTLGFRGEALASICSVAQVELRSKRREDEIGTQIIIEGSEFKSQHPINCPNGTTINVKNLFFNIPARRNFLKSNTLELRHVIEEFFRVAIVNPNISFSFYNQDKILYKLTSGNIKQRILNIFGNHYAQRLIPVEQATDMVNITGFIGKPEFARKTRSEQYFFTNGRFMRSPYLNNAVERAFRELIPDDSNPLYFLFFEVPPNSVDVNIHPTKTEINFLDNKGIYAILHSSVKQSIGRFNLAPEIDFEVENGLKIPPLPENYQPKQPVINIDPHYNPFEKKINKQPAFNFPNPSGETIRKWQELYADTHPVEPVRYNNQELSAETTIPMGIPAAEEPEKKINWQVQRTFIVTSTKTGIIIIDQQNAHERILFERFSQVNDDFLFPSQVLLFPQTVNLSPDNAALYNEWKEHFSAMGFEINDFGNGSFVIHAFPFQIQAPDAVSVFEGILENLRSSETKGKLNERQELARSLARKMSVKRGKTLQQQEIDTLVENLFACNVPELTPDGKPTMIKIPFDEIYKKLRIYS